MERVKAMEIVKAKKYIKKYAVSVSKRLTRRRELFEYSRKPTVEFHDRAQSAMVVVVVVVVVVIVIVIVIVIVVVVVVVVVIGVIVG